MANAWRYRVTAMLTEVQLRIGLLAIVAASLLGGCATKPPASESRAQRTAPAVDPASPSPVPADTEEVVLDDPISAVLAERRRDEYPQFEFQEAGFTITEQVRIGGSARTEYERALQLLGQERFAEGIALLESVTVSTPDATAPYIDLGIAYRMAGEIERSEAALSTAALLSPDHPVVLNELGIVYRQTGRFMQARTSYEKALAVFADFHYARRNLAVLCDLYLADLDCARRNYAAYLESAGRDPEVEIWLADVTNRLGNQGG